MIKNFLFFLLGSISVLTVFMTFRHQSKGPGCVIEVFNCRDLYAGIDNPISIITQEDDSISLDQVTCRGGIITGNEGRFIVHPESPGELTITVKAHGKEQTWKFNVKFIIPVPHLGGQYEDGTILSAKEFKAQQGVTASIPDCCGFDAKCDVVSYSITRISKTGQVSKAENEGARFGKAATELIQNAKAGDIYLFSKVFSFCFWKPEYGSEKPPFLSTLLIEII